MQSNEQVKTSLVSLLPLMFRSIISMDVKW